MKRWIFVAALVALGFAVGVTSSSNVLGFGRLMQGSVPVRCIDHRACVGDAVDAFLIHYEEDQGGLTGVFCKSTEVDHMGRRVGDYFFLPDIVQGKTCPNADYLLEFRNPSTRTLVTIEGGIVVHIEQGPLHVIDL